MVKPRWNVTPDTPSSAGVDMGVNDVRRPDGDPVGGLMSSKDVALLYSYIPAPPVPQPLQVLPLRRHMPYMHLAMKWSHSNMNLSVTSLGVICADWHV